MFGKVLTILLAVTFLVAGFSLYFNFSNKSRIEKLEKAFLASQEQEEEFAKKFQDLAKESVQLATQSVVVVPHPVIEGKVTKKNSVANFLSHYWWIILYVVVLIIIIRYRKRIWDFIAKLPIPIILVGIITFCAGSVWADNQNPSVYQGIYDNLKSQKDSIGELSAWQGLWDSAMVLKNSTVGEAQAYTDKKFANLSKRLAEIEKGEGEKLIAEQKVVPVVRAEKPKLDFSFAQQKPNINHLWGEPIVGDLCVPAENRPQGPVDSGETKTLPTEADKLAEKTSLAIQKFDQALKEAGLEPEKSKESALVGETLEQKVSRLEQEKKEAQDHINDLEKEVEKSAIAEQNSVISGGRRYVVKYGRIEVQKEDSK